ncbi:BnaA08g20680D [Brassica napus]|uniref:BnaA08g20680D protein n=1 Tax=Brassica napus TaxID=3708 RepID=A0A078HUQ9_BRANA|nr:BnaA08g20680D [Brassica napus]
MHTSKLKRYR